MENSGSVRTVLVADFQPSIIRSYTKAFHASGLETIGVSSVDAAFAAIESAEFAGIVFDFELIETRMADLVSAARARFGPLPIIATSANGSLAKGIDAIRSGCDEYFLKPVSIKTLVDALNADQSNADKAPSRKLVQKPAVSFIGSSRPILGVMHLVERYAPSNAPVLITGASGTGKEVCAQNIHAKSRRANGPFMAINCAALPHDLMEAELFGHVKGAFTGAQTDRAGAVLSAHGGTLFLDEIGELHPSLQAKLLRFLQTGTIKAVGSDKIRPVDVRIVAATNRSLPEEVAKGAFREDLYYRLDVLSIEMPSLRSRGHDVLDLAATFLDYYGQLEDRPGGYFDGSAKQAIMEYGWPGNVRELQNCVRRAVILAPDKQIGAAHLFPAGQRNDVFGMDEQDDFAMPQPTRPQEAPFVNKLRLAVMQPLSNIEREVIEAVISECEGSLTRAAQILQVSPSTLYRKRESWAATDADGALEDASVAGQGHHPRIRLASSAM